MPGTVTGWFAHHSSATKAIFLRIAYCLFLFMKIMDVATS